MTFVPSTNSAMTNFLIIDEQQLLRNKNWKQPLSKNKIKEKKISSEDFTEFYFFLFKK